MSSDSPSDNPESSAYSPQPKLLIVDDEEDIRTQMKWALAQDYMVSLAQDRGSAMGIVEREKPAVVTLDLGLPPRPADVEEGFATLSEILSFDPFIKVIIITGRGEKEHALKAVGEGAYDFMYKPVQLDELKVVLKRAFYVSSLEREHHLLQRQVGGKAFQGMLGTSPQMQEVFSTVHKVATTEAPVLIIGDSGTGKELVSQAIHRLSGRKDGPFVVINCGAIPETLLESELFGHEKGSFTGAHVQRKGRIEAARGGTLFLDEIGELSLALQVKLLRFLQEQVIERIGGREQIRVDARVITATNRDLKQAMKTGGFREDLYFRLAVVTIQMPLLRDREGDLLLLAKAFLTRYSEESRRKISGFTPQALRAIQTYSWPGNVRELENRIKRAVIMAEGNKITPADLELGNQPGKDEYMNLKSAREALEKEMILKALSKYKDNVTRASEALGVSRPTLYELMEKLGIERK
ncbi:MAG: PEP-CTERM-box response regulator transcription factor [Syntrophaceae bacterium]|jgi:two-component system NtrC family response regulator|nr:PEP-CTERM-box response regulator transcription factor [Syntrophaceae bacterium]